MHNHIDTLHKLFLNETQSFRKVHRMIDLYGSILKSHTALIIAEYVNRNMISEAAKGLLAEGLRTPSLGAWQLFSRVLFAELLGSSYHWMIPFFADEFAEFDEALNVDKTNIISFRNRYAHGAVSG